jgi:hypothetical protein
MKRDEVSDLSYPAAASVLALLLGSPQGTTILLLWIGQRALAIGEDNQYGSDENALTGVHGIQICLSDADLMCLSDADFRYLSGLKELLQRNSLRLHAYVRRATYYRTRAAAGIGSASGIGAEGPGINQSAAVVH